MPRTKRQKTRNERAFSPATSDDERERQVISLAYDLAEKQLRDGNASSQVLTHFLKMGCERERLERDILQEQKKLVVARTESMEAQQRMEEKYNEAIKAMKRYQGDMDDEYEDYD